MDGGAWWAAVHGVARSQTRLSDFTLFFHFHALEKEMATHSSVLAWRIPGMGEPGGLPSMGSHRVGHNRSDLTAAAAAASFKVSISKNYCHQPLRKAQVNKPPQPELCHCSCKQVPSKDFSLSHLNGMFSCLPGMYPSLPGMYLMLHMTAP